MSADTLRDLALFAFYHVVLSAVWVVFASLAALRLDLAGLALSVGGSLVVAAARRAVSPAAAMLAGDLVVVLLGALAGARRCRLLLASHAKAPSAPRSPDALILGARAPVLALGAGSLALLVVDRLFVWCAGMPVRDVARYESETGLGLATLVVPAAAAECLAIHFERASERDAASLSVDATKAFRARARRRVVGHLGRLAALFALSAGGTLLVARVLGLRPGWTFVATVLASGLLVAGAFGALLHTQAAREARASRAILEALAVAVATSGLASRAIAPTWAIAGTVLGAAVYAGRMVRGALRLAGRGDHTRYAAF